MTSGYELPTRQLEHQPRGIRGLIQTGSSNLASEGFYTAHYSLVSTSMH